MRNLTIHHPMKESELKEMAGRLGIPLHDIARWHLVNGPRFVTQYLGRPKGKLKRPKGTLSVGEIIQKYGIDHHALRQWRERGMPHRKIGRMIVVQQRVLDRWVKEKWGGDGGL